MTNWYDNVPVPVDSNGREVTLDTSELLLDGERRIVMCYLYGPRTRRWYVEFAGVDERRHLTHCTLPDSWEKLEEDVRDTRDVKWSLVTCRYYHHDTEDSCVGCPARSEDNCENAVLVDIVRRAKALAGIEVEKEEDND